MARNVLRETALVTAGVAFWLALASAFGVPFQQERTGPAKARVSFEQSLLPDALSPSLLAP